MAPSTLRIGDANDVFEQEADRVADQIMRGGTLGCSFGGICVGPALQRKCACGGQGECEECKDKVLQRKPSGPVMSSEAPSLMHDVLRSSGRPLEGSLRRQFEPRFRVDFSRVRVHADPEASAAAKAVSARAFTIGSDIVFGFGQYSPGTREGQRLIAHELAHVMQQSMMPDAALKRVPETRVQRTCVSGVPCPGAAVELPAGWPWSESAEICIRTDYTRQRAGNLIGNNNTWQFMNMPPGTPAKRDHDCFKSSLMAKSGMFLAQPDIIDFTSAEIYDVTTTSQAQGHRVRVDADTKQATALAATPGCGGSSPPSGRTWSPGAWNPPLGCYWIGGDIYLRAENIGGGLLIYHVLKDVKGEVITVTLLATLAALLKSGKAAMDAGKAVAGGTAVAGGKAVAARALAYANLAAIAILLASGKAEAKAGPGGEMPIETLFKAMAQKGSPVPPELQESMKAYLDANPELKKKVEDAATKGDMTDAQKEISDRAMKIISEHPEQFDQGDLELMLAANEAAGSSLPASELTAAKLRAALDARKRGQTGLGSGTDITGPSSSPSGKQPRTTDKPAEKTLDQPGQKTPDQKPEDKGKPPEAGGKQGSGYVGSTDIAKSSLSQASKDKLAAVPTNVRNLFVALTQGPGTGTPITDAQVDRFLAIVPFGLTTEQAQTLISRLAEAQSPNVDQVLDRLKAAVGELEKKQLDAAASGAIGAAPDAGAAPDPEVLDKLAKMAHTADFKGLAKTEIRFTWRPDDVKGDTIHGILRYVSGKGVQAVAWATATVSKRDSKQAIRSIKIESSTPMVSADKSVIAQSSALVGRELNVLR